MSILSWLVVGLIAGWLAGTIMKGGGYGLIGDIVVGVLGALWGEFLATLLFGGDYVTAQTWYHPRSVCRAVALIWLVRVLPGRSPL